MTMTTTTTTMMTTTTSAATPPAIAPIGGAGAGAVADGGAAGAVADSAVAAVAVSVAPLVVVGGATKVDVSVLGSVDAGVPLALATRVTVDADGGNGVVDGIDGVNVAVVASVVVVASVANDVDATPVVADASLNTVVGPCGVVVDAGVRRVSSRRHQPTIGAAR